MIHQKILIYNSKLILLIFLNNVYNSELILLYTLQTIILTNLSKNIISIVYAISITLYI